MGGGKYLYLFDGDGAARRGERRVFGGTHRTRTVEDIFGKVQSRYDIYVRHFARARLRVPDVVTSYRRMLLKTRVASRRVALGGWRGKKK